jgi:hypothetical protein
MIGPSHVGNNFEGVEGAILTRLETPESPELGTWPSFAMLSTEADARVMTRF